MRLRAVRDDEAERLREIRLACLATDPAAFTSAHAAEVAKPEEWWTRWATLSAAGSEQRTFVVTDAEDGWHGLALVRADDERPGEAVINSMWVAPTARRRGAGLELCAACVRWATERGFRAINLCVMRGNDAALRLYESAGFTVRSRTPDQLSMTRRLP
jgi:ribosomal protein S18 acetylase RimI-like enzyme